MHFAPLISALFRFSNVVKCVVGHDSKKQNLNMEVLCSFAVADSQLYMKYACTVILPRCRTTVSHLTELPEIFERDEIE